jgi:hypothetical protein
VWLDLKIWWHTRKLLALLGQPLGWRMNAKRLLYIFASRIGGFSVTPAEYELMCERDEKAIDLFLAENANRGATLNDWLCATKELRANYRRAVQD